MFKDRNILLLGLLGLGFYTVWAYNKGKLLNRESKGQKATSSGGGGFNVPIFNIDVKKDEEKKDVTKDPLTVKIGGDKPIDVKKSLNTIEKQQIMNPSSLPTTTMGMGSTTTTTTTPKTSTLSTTSLNDMKLGAMPVKSKFVGSDDMEYENFLID